MEGANDFASRSKILLLDFARDLHLAMSSREIVGATSSLSCLILFAMIMVLQQHYY